MKDTQGNGIGNVSHVQKEGRQGEGKGERERAGGEGGGHTCVEYYNEFTVAQSAKGDRPKATNETHTKSVYKCTINCLRAH